MLLYLVLSFRYYTYYELLDYFVHVDGLNLKAFAVLLFSRRPIVLCVIRELIICAGNNHDAMNYHIILLILFIATTPCHECNIHVNTKDTCFSSKHIIDASSINCTRGHYLPSVSCAFHKYDIAFEINKLTWYVDNMQNIKKSNLHLSVGGLKL